MGGRCRHYGTARSVRSAHRDYDAQTQYQLTGYILISPWLIGLTLLHLWPIINSLWMSLDNWDLFTEPNLFGLGNCGR